MSAVELSRSDLSGAVMADAVLLEQSWRGQDLPEPIFKCRYLMG